MSRLEIFVPGVPVQKGSHKAWVPPGASYANITDDSPNTKPWQAYVRFCVSQKWRGPPSVKPCQLTCVFFFPRPKNHYYHRKSGDVLRDDAPTHKTSKPDLGKLERPIEDAMTGIAYVDDSQVVRHNGAKPYVNTINNRPGVRIVLEEL